MIQHLLIQYTILDATGWSLHAVTCGKVQGRSELEANRKVWLEGVWNVMHWKELFTLRKLYGRRDFSTRLFVG